MIEFSGNVIHFVADILLLSIENVEHIDREAVSTTYKISGPSQKRPTDGTVALKCSSLRNHWLHFL